MQARYLSRRIKDGDVSALPAAAAHRSPLERLSLRERDVLRLLAEGLSMTEVGAKLGIAARTVAYHNYRMLQTLSLRSSAELVGFAIRNGLGGYALGVRATASPRRRSAAPLPTRG